MNSICCFHYSKKICDVYGGDKNLILVEGDHNSNRPAFMFTSAGIFLSNVLQVKESWALADSQKYIGGLRPWDFVGSSSASRSNNHFAGLDDEDAALERILALSLLVRLSVSCIVSFDVDQVFLHL